ncbi:biliverdin-producing heme oxygenase [Zavarzinia sp. CC-PAN008]|uniref:biliverdin-producing heme oxygenase n=1 Tax=Zavarzinia sp. CC-PAN008 TaxID=3243332 RepID=UPI003F742D77
MNLVNEERPPDAAAPSIRARLRAATAARHAQVDEGFAAYDLATPAGYGAFLATHAAALLPLEAALEQAGVADLLPDWPQRRRSAALLQDLADLGVDPGPSVTIALDADAAALLGTLYVLEGSRRGAAYLLKAVAQGRDPKVQGAVRYLAHGRGQGLWPGFVARLEADEDVATNPHRTLAAADRAFVGFLDALAAGRAAR